MRGSIIITSAGIINKKVRINMAKKAVKTNKEETIREKALLWLPVNVYSLFLLGGFTTATKQLRIAAIMAIVIWGILSAILIYGIYFNKQAKARWHCIYALLAVVALNTVLFTAAMTPAFRKTQLYYDWKCGGFERIETINATIKNVGYSEHHGAVTTTYIYTYVMEDESGNTTVFEDSGTLWNAAVNGRELPMSIAIDKTNVDGVYLYGIENIKRVG